MAMRVYLVDDDALHRRALAALLRHWGMTVVGQADNGRTALADLSPTGPAAGADAIVTDCQMPEMDGLALTRALRARGDGRAIVMVSGQSHPDTLRAARSAGVTHFLPKPLDPTLLAPTLHPPLPLAA